MISEQGRVVLEDQKSVKSQEWDIKEQLGSHFIAPEEIFDPLK